MNESAVGVGI